MGRILDLCGAIATECEEGAEGLELPPDSWDRLRASWPEEDIEDALKVVQENFLQSELVEAADSLSARLVDVLGAAGDGDAFAEADKNGLRLDLDVVDQLARRVGRLEEILNIFRDDPPPDRRGFDELVRRLLNRGIEEQMENDDE